jgi:opacity protein-like surface antigen
MRTTLAAAAALLATTIASSAADLAPAYTKAAPMATVYNWTGFYIGGNLGGGMASSHFDDPCFYCSSATPTSGFFTGGAQIGYNYQFGSGLIGIEADVNGNSNFKSSVIGGDDQFAMTVKSNIDVSGTIRARGGLVINNALVYATGGFAWANVKQTGAEFCQSLTPCFNFATGVTTPVGALSGITANRSGTVWGGVIGAGVEFAVTQNWIVGGEFLHTMYQDRDATILEPSGANACVVQQRVNGANCFVRNQLTTDVARVRFSYKFN